MSAQGYIGAGNVQFSPMVAGVAQGYGLPRETAKFEIKPNSSLKELKSKSRDNYGNIIETIAIADAPEIKVTLRQSDYENLLLSFMGAAGVAINQAAATVIDEAITAKRGRYVQLANRNIQAAGFAVKNSAGTVTYTLGTDYLVNYRLGEVLATETGAITDAQSLKVDYSANAITGKTILGAKNAQLRAMVRFDGINLADQAPMLIECWEAVFTSDSAFDALSDDFAEISLSGKLKTPQNKLSAFVVEFPEMA
jgi:hypothetical protein